MASDDGASIRDGIKSVATLGDCPEKVWPYDIKKFASTPSKAAFTEALRYKAVQYQRVSRVLNQMKGCMASGYPFVFGFSVYESFESQKVAKSGVVPMPAPSETLLGGHAVLAVGYDDAMQRFIVRNSWGPKWGMRGYFTMPYGYLTRRGICRTTSGPSASSPTEARVGQNRRMRTFEAAPWSNSLRVVSGVSTIVLVAVVIAMPGWLAHAARAPFTAELRALLPFLPLAILAGALLFMVRGYELDGRSLLVRRLLWNTRVRLDGLQRAWHDPACMRKSMRIFGNGGLYSITGYYRNTALGAYRAFVTDRGRAVVLKTPARVVVVSPERPEQFLRALGERFPAVSMAAPPV